MAQAGDRAAPRARPGRACVWLTDVAGQWGCRSRGQLVWWGLGAFLGVHVGAFRVQCTHMPRRSWSALNPIVAAPAAPAAPPRPPGCGGRLARGQPRSPTRATKPRNSQQKTLAPRGFVGLGLLACVRKRCVPSCVYPGAPTAQSPKALVSPPPSSRTGPSPRLSRRAKI
jgi:hypothetical protein